MSWKADSLTTVTVRLAVVDSMQPTAATAAMTTTAADATAAMTTTAADTTAAMTTTAADATAATVVKVATAAMAAKAALAAIGASALVVQSLSVDRRFLIQPCAVGRCAGV